MVLGDSGMEILVCINSAIAGFPLQRGLRISSRLHLSRIYALISSYPISLPAPLLHPTERCAPSIVEVAFESKQGFRCLCKRNVLVTDSLVCANAAVMPFLQFCSVLFRVYERVSEWPDECVQLVMGGGGNGSVGVVLSFPLY
ncbi:hypothetical protein CEXT_553711 [Caerostris extrusa]|uniref:Uncharacterized protein n=1 Tax=Caerostris extrusa TaxID=172846 RepID=A0AAV4PVD7_CAEEX|nr:hypothetical protein CEXT_553711 [Caerostris extrusa]